MLRSVIVASKSKAVTPAPMPSSSSVGKKSNVRIPLYTPRFISDATSAPAGMTTPPWLTSASSRPLPRNEAESAEIVTCGAPHLKSIVAPGTLPSRSNPASSTSAVATVLLAEIPKSPDGFNVP